jgi:hypothetical protein
VKYGCILKYDFPGKATIMGECDDLLYVLTAHYARGHQADPSHHSPTILPGRKCCLYEDKCVKGDKQITTLRSDKSRNFQNEVREDLVFYTSVDKTQGGTLIKYEQDRY